LKVCEDLALLKDDTRQLVDMTRKFHDPIHPGRSIRLAQRCDKRTALSALAALEGVISDLS
jgi:hypothetical protein